MHKSGIKGLLFCIILLFSASLHAGAYDDATFLSCHSVVPSFTLNMPNIQDSIDIGVNQPLSDWVESNYEQIYSDCKWYAPLLYELFLYTEQPQAGGDYEGHTIYKTNLPGVGVIISGKGSVQNHAPSAYKPLTANRTVVDTFSIVSPFSPFPASAQVRVRLIKTGPVTPGELSENIGMFLGGVESYHEFGPKTFIYLASGTVNTSSCNILTPDIVVPLGDHSVSEFSGVNSGTDWRSFDIALRCDPGSEVSVEINGNIDNTKTGVLYPDPVAGMVVGVGIMIADNNYDPIQLGKYLLPVPVDPNGNITFPFNARYVQTESGIRSGTANATATITLHYK